MCMPEEGIRSPETGVGDVFESTYGCWQSNPGPSTRASSAFNNEPSPQSCFKFFVETRSQILPMLALNSFCSLDIPLIISPLLQIPAELRLEHQGHLHNAGEEGRGGERGQGGERRGQERREERGAKGGRARERGVYPRCPHRHAYEIVSGKSGGLEGGFPVPDVQVCRSLAPSESLSLKLCGP